jgi:hypothetical protein
MDAMQSVSDKVLTRIHRKPSGFAFSGKDFLDLASRASVDKALSTLARSGRIRRIARGVYDRPRASEELGGELSPDYDQVAQAIARSNGVRIEAPGAGAANLLGLSTQVPAKIVYLTNGTSRTFRIGDQTIAFERVGPRQLRAKAGTSSLVVQALRYLGKDRMEEAVIEHLRTHLSPSERRSLLRDARYTSDWVFEVIKRVASQETPDHGR